MGFINNNKKPVLITLIKREGKNVGSERHPKETASRIYIGGSLAWIVTWSSIKSLVFFKDGLLYNLCPPPPPQLLFSLSKHCYFKKEKSAARLFQSMNQYRGDPGTSVSPKGFQQMFPTVVASSAASHTALEYLPCILVALGDAVCGKVNWNWPANFCFGSWKHHIKWTWLRWSLLGNKIPSS